MGFKYLMISSYNTVSARAEDFDGITFQRVTGSGHIKRVCDNIAAAGDDHEKVAMLKRKLPGVTWQAYQQRGTTRAAAQSIANGLFMLDYDHVEDPKALWERIDRERKANYPKDEVMVAHITPSGRGLRIVAKRYNTRMTIPECQEVFSSHYGIVCDKAVKDLSRLSFLVPRDYFLFFDPNVFDYQWELSSIEQTQTAMGLCNNNENEDENENLFNENYNGNHNENSIGEKVERIRRLNEKYNVNHNGNDKVLAREFMGIKYKDLVAAVIERTGGMPEVGERNTRLYELARLLRYTVDFDAQILEQIIPSFGLSQSEVQSTVRSAVNSTRSERMPEKLYSIIKEFKEANENANENEDENGDGSGKLVDVERLPPVFREFVRVAPDDFKKPTLFSLLPILGTLASTARAKYLDNSYHSPSFITVVTAPQASGKSFTRKLVRECHTALMAQDAIARQEEQQYRKALREAKNSKNQPEEPTTTVRCVPASVSVAKLLKRLDNAHGLHLFTFCEEVDTVAKSNNSGAWAQKSDLYRNAFDNAAYGQDYMTDISYSATLEVFYNLLLLGTPNAVGRFFKDPEDGLVSRVCFTQIPDQFGADMPVWQEMQAEEKRLVSDACQKLLERHSNSAEKRYYDLSSVNDTLKEWLRKQGDMAVASVSRARDTARRRAAVVGFRAALLAKAIAETVQTEVRNEDLNWFATYVADTHLNEILSMYGGAMEASLSKTAKRSGQAFNSLYDEMGQTFGYSDVTILLSKHNVKSPVTTVIHRWKQKGWIEKTANNQYKKCKV